MRRTSSWFTLDDENSTMPAVLEQDDNVIVPSRPKSPYGRPGRGRKKDDLNIISKEFPRFNGEIFQKGVFYKVKGDPRTCIVIEPQLRAPLKCKDVFASGVRLQKQLLGVTQKQPLHVKVDHLSHCQLSVGTVKAGLSFLGRAADPAPRG